MTISLMVLTLMKSSADNAVVDLSYLFSSLSGFILQSLLHCFVPYSVFLVNSCYVPPTMLLLKCGMP